MDFYKNLGQKLKNLRKSNGHTQEYLAQRIGSTKSAIVNYEGGLRKIPLETVVCIAELYDVSLDSLVLGREKSIQLTTQQEKIMLEFIKMLLGVIEDGKGLN